MVDKSAKYTPDSEVKIHEQAIKLLCAPFQSHENGLPEWFKNSSDEYLRRQDPTARRVIVLLLVNGKKGDRQPAIACLDFGGMTSNVIDHKYGHWGDPDASKAQGDPNPAEKVEGGHGNGGKCYSAQMFNDRALIYTVNGGYGNKYGTVAGNYRFGYFPDRRSGKDFPVSDLRAELQKALIEIGADVGWLPGEALEALDSGDGFTLTYGVGPKGYAGKRLPAKRLLDDLRDHPQMLRSLDHCRVFVVAGGKALDGGQPVRPSEIPPFPGGEAPRIVAIPEELTDPFSEETVSTTNDGVLPTGELVLRTSERSMRQSKRARHRVTFKVGGAPIGNKPVLDFDVQSSYKDRIFGDVTLAALEPFVQNMRGALADGPLTRALDAWIAAQIEEYARVFEARDRRKHSEEEKNAVAEMNEALDQWKNELLATVLTDTNGPGDPPPPPPPTPLSAKEPVRIDLSTSHARSGVGVPMRPSMMFFDADGGRAKPVAVDWFSSNPEVALVDPDLNVLETFAPGAVTLHAETLDGKVVSSAITIEVVEIDAITIAPDVLEVPLGSRRRLEAICTLPSGEVVNDVLLVWEESNKTIAAVNSAGLVFGFTLGSTTVVARDDNVRANNDAVITVVEAQNGGGSGGDGGGAGRGYPRVLISEYQSDPDTGQPVVLSPDDPPVYQRAQDVDRNIWWINAAAPLARVYLDRESGYGYATREWRIYHTEQFIQVVVQILMVADPNAQDDTNVGDWIALWGQRAIEVQASAAKSLGAFIHNGDLSEL